MTEAERTLKPTGDLTTKEVPMWHAKTLNATALPAQIDLSGVERTDSSALAWLLDLQARASKKQLDIKFVHPPKALITLAGLSGVGKLLGWEEPASSAPNNSSANATT